jgi:hypothetical protein
MASDSVEMSDVSVITTINWTCRHNLPSANGQQRKHRIIVDLRPILPGGGKYEYRQARTLKRQYRAFGSTHFYVININDYDRLLMGDLDSRFPYKVCGPVLHYLFRAAMKSLSHLAETNWQDDNYRRPNSHKPRRYGFRPTDKVRNRASHDIS